MRGQSQALAVFLLLPGRKIPGAYWMENWAVPTASLKILEKGKLPTPVIHIENPTRCNSV
jgi:hypothetical protein